ncbi:MAG: hypothetical protein DRN26_02420 [Thermoplasmata archaeon]|mgnify:CR=1 FL=1|nr:MAG: hypothetical protein DRN26_02420 [Thermoplasmata archaeon]
MITRDKLSRLGDRYEWYLYLADKTLKKIPLYIQKIFRKKARNTTWIIQPPHTNDPWFCYLVPAQNYEFLKRLKAFSVRLHTIFHVPLLDKPDANVILHVYGSKVTLSTSATCREATSHIIDFFKRDRMIISGHSQLIRHWAFDSAR